MSDHTCRDCSFFALDDPNYPECLAVPEWYQKRGSGQRIGGICLEPDRLTLARRCPCLLLKRDDEANHSESPKSSIEVKP